MWSESQWSTHLVVFFNPLILVVKKGRTYLKELQNCILHTILVWLLFYSMQVYTSLHFLPFFFVFFFRKLAFFVFLHFFVFSVCSKFDVIFINFCNICIIIIYIAGARYSVFLSSTLCFCSHLSLLT